LRLVTTPEEGVGLVFVLSKQLEFSLQFFGGVILSLLRLNRSAPGFVLLAGLSGGEAGRSSRSSLWLLLLGSRA